MKVLRVLDQSETRLLTDLLNQMILRELVLSERSVTGLAKKLNSSTLKLWRRMQKLESSGLIELSRVKRSGNIETKLYRATAASYVPDQFLRFRPTNPRLMDAFAVFSEFQRRLAAVMQESNKIPEGADPVDYSLYVTMRSFVRVYDEPRAQERMTELKRKLEEFERPV
jgi:DNA-binding Lrp family transcriptional regulator